MKNVKRRIILLCLSVFLFSSSEIYSRQVEYPDYLYEEFRKTPSPINNARVRINPTELLWPSVKHCEGRDVVYNVYLSRDSLFPQGNTQISRNQRYCFYNPHKALKPGKWYWKYEIVDKDKIETKGTYSFIVSKETPVFTTPSFGELLNNISRSHPRVMNQGNNIATVRQQAVNHPAYRTIVTRAREVLKREIYDGPLGDKDPAKDKKLSGVTGEEIRYFHDALQGYVLTGEKTLFENLQARIKVLLTWPTHDLLGSQVLTALSLSYDVMYDSLPDTLKGQMLRCIEGQMNKGLKNWPGRIETRQVENHFWQMEISGNFSAALATVHDSEVAKDMLEYTYELFIARFPNLSTKYDGGWAEGMGYFGVNKSCVVDMALWMKKIAGADVFQMPWYKNLSDFYTYFAPVNSQIAGFGDMHDRRRNGSGEGISSTFILSCESHDLAANYRLLSHLKTAKDPAAYLNSIEPWYQIVNNVKLEPAKLELPQFMPNEKVFYSTGLAAMHNDIKRVEEGTSVYFRSSPFGAKGHMHANQNSFNIARRGERIFYSTGYYTSFADPHSMTSYRNTRASNTVLVNGCGQAFGHEGYGFIKRFLAGEEITYVCGDATAAYKPTVDKQFLSMNAGSGVKETKEYGVGDAKLKLFERHLAFIRPDIVVVYDVLESEQDCDWTFLLHTMKGQQPDIDGTGTLRVNTSLNSACVNVFGSSPVAASYTDRFFSPAIDFKKKYKEVPNQYHISYKTSGKSKSMRFLAVLQLGDKGGALLPVCPDEQGTIKLGEVTIRAELDVNKPAEMKVHTRKTTLNVYQKQGCSILQEAGGKKTCHNRYPEQMTLFTPQ